MVDVEEFNISKKSDFIEFDRYWKKILVFIVFDKWYIWKLFIYQRQESETFKVKRDA